jgi:hypothetical protein
MGWIGCGAGWLASWTQLFSCCACTRTSNTLNRCHRRHRSSPPSLKMNHKGETRAKKKVEQARTTSVFTSATSSTLALTLPTVVQLEVKLGGSAQISSEWCCSMSSDNAPPPMPANDGGRSVFGAVMAFEETGSQRLRLPRLLPGSSAAHTNDLSSPSATALSVIMASSSPLCGAAPQASDVVVA